MLDVLLGAHETGPLDPPCQVGFPTGRSLLITALEGVNDLYVSQPQLLYDRALPSCPTGSARWVGRGGGPGPNDHPVYIGHSRGHYIYYYVHQPTEPPPAYGDGWCLSPYLGARPPIAGVPLPRSSHPAVCPPPSSALPSGAAGSVAGARRLRLGDLEPAAPSDADSDNGHSRSRSISRCPGGGAGHRGRRWGWGKEALWLAVLCSSVLNGCAGCPLSRRYLTTNTHALNASHHRIRTTWKARQGTRPKQGAAANGR